MKKYITLAILLSPFWIYCQDSTKFIINKKLKVNFQYILGTEISAINNSPITSAVGEIGLILNKKIVVSFFAASSLNSPQKISGLNSNTSNPKGISLSGEQGGVRLGYIFSPQKAFHWSANVKLGKIYIEDTSDLDKFIISKPAFSLVPEISPELNLTRSIRLKMGFGYRFVSKSDKFYLNNSMNSFVYSFSLQFAKYAKK